MKKKVSIKLHTNDPKCKYKVHREPGAVFDFELLGPKGLCLDAYLSAYPYCLTLMYKGVFKFMKDPNTITFQCPSPVKPIVMEARRIQIAEDMIKIVITVKDILNLNNQCENSCKCNMKVGQQFEFNGWGQRPEICPAGFLHIFPYLTTLMRGGKVPWSTGKNSFLVHCPDEKINVTYEVVLEDEKK